MSDEPMQIVVVLASGRQEFPIEPATARRILAENRHALQLDGWPDSAFETQDRGELREGILRFFAEGLHPHRRRSRSDADQEAENLFYLSDAAGGSWAIPARSILALGVVDSTAPAGAGRTFTFGPPDRSRGRYANPE